MADGKMGFNSAIKGLMGLKRSIYRRADTSLALSGRKKAAPVKSVQGRGMD